MHFNIAAREISLPQVELVSDDGEIINHVLLWGELFYVFGVFFCWRNRVNVHSGRFDSDLI